MSATLEDDGVYEELKSVPTKFFEMNSNTCYDGPNPTIEHSSRRNHSGKDQAKKSKKKIVITIAVAMIIAVTLVALIALAIGLGVGFLLSNKTDFQEALPPQETSRLDDTAVQINDSIATLRLQVSRELSAIEASMNNLSRKIASLETTAHATDTRLHEFKNTTSGQLLSLETTAHATDARLQKFETATTGQLQSLEITANVSIAQLTQKSAQNISTLQDMIEQFFNSSTGTDQLLKTKVSTLEDQFVTLSQHSPDGQYSFRPTASCSALPDCFPSGYYWVQASNGSAVRVYCDMTRSCGGVTGGWTRVAYLDMTNSSHQCPGGLQEHNESSFRMCIQNLTFRAGCTSLHLSVSNINYSSICGKVIGYQLGSPDGFYGQRLNSYLDGVSMTRGDPRVHVWSFAAASPPASCPCNQSGLNETDTTSAPSIVGEDYFCEARTLNANTQIFDIANPLWDGAGCGPESIGYACCSFNNPPWFYKQVPQLTTDDIEVRLCRAKPRREDIAIEAFEVYIQ